MGMSWVIVLFKAPKSTDTSEDDKFLTHLRTLTEESNQLVSAVGVVPVLDFEFIAMEELSRALDEGDEYAGKLHLRLLRK